jgi:AbrB family looped-hinge helix DNA binding protein
VKKFVKQLRHGQITIPKNMRDALGIEAEDLLSIELSDGKLEIEPVRVARKGAGSPWLLELYELFAPVRASLDSYTEEEINDAIDEAVKAARHDRRP